MPTAQDYKKQLLTSLGYSGAMPNMERQFYVDRGGSAVGNLNDAMMGFLAAQGFTTGSLPDRWMAYLRSQGYTGSLNDMWIPFWINYSDSGSFRLLTEGGDFITAENGTDFLRT